MVEERIDTPFFTSSNVTIEGEFGAPDTAIDADQTKLRVADVLKPEEFEELEGMVISLKMMIRHYSTFKEGKTRVHHPVIGEEVEFDVPQEKIDEYAGQIEELFGRLKEKVGKLGLLPEMEAETEV